MAGDNATITALPNSEFTTAVTVRQLDVCVVACAVVDAITNAATIIVINERIDFSLNEDESSAVREAMRDTADAPRGSP
jgi:hypothetical protein